MRGHYLPAITPWLLAAALALVLATAHHLDDGIPDHHAEWAQAEDLQLAINRAAAENRFATAAQQICGPQAAWEQLVDGSVQCRTKYGRPTVTVQVSP